MLNKQSVWCQIASVFTAVLALSAFFSVQHLTLTQDIYWSFVLGFTSFFRFAVGEHRHQCGISIDHLVKGGAIWTNILHILILNGLFMNCTPRHFPIVAGLGVAVSFAPKVRPVLVLSLLRYPDGLTLLLLGIMGFDHAFRRTMASTVGMPQNSVQLKQATAVQSVSILLEALLLWHLRCQHRFPYQYRWSPVLCSAVLTSSVVLWCYWYLPPTLTTSRSIVKRIGHGLTPSLNAIQSCPTCAACLTCLDIEEVYG
jgi:hypothetical protein